ncbi:MAG: mechanosensitive ion channel family protein [Gallionellaceae bacterium]|nr:MAG: mechanosensitive ion channel family protein [Gallionellaceae bacterium]
MNESAYHFGLSFLSDPTLPRVVAVVLFVVAFNLVLRFVLHRIELATQYTDSPWDDALIHAARRPVSVLAWVVGLAYAAQIIHKEKGVFFFDLVAPFRDIATIVCGAWFLFRLIRNVAHNMLSLRAQNEEVADSTTIDALSKLSRFAVVVISAIMSMHVLGFSVSGVLAFGGLGGIAVGFAARDILANFFGGLTIYMDRPFVVGETIRSPDKALEGVVEHIGWRLTTIRSLNKSAIYVPNALFTTIVVENVSRITNRRINETIGLRYADLAAMTAIVNDVRAMLAAHPEIDTAAKPGVSFDRFADSALNFSINAFTQTTDGLRFQEIKQEILLKVAEIIARHGAEIAFPTRTLLIEKP